MISFEYIIVLIPAMILAFYAQNKVQSAFNKYSKVRNKRGITGAEAARMILDANGLEEVKLKTIKGKLTDNYSPESKWISLSDEVYGKDSLAAVGVAAHETGHALQDAKGYAPLVFKNMMIMPTMVCSKLAMPIILVGILFGAYEGTSVGFGIVKIGIVFFAVSVLLSLITLPVEFNASKRAMELLVDYGIIDSDEVAPVKSVLSAAALTYVASAASAIASLLRLILIFRRRND